MQLTLANYCAIFKLFWGKF